jgi:hypothetical protein
MGVAIRTKRSHVPTERGGAHICVTSDRQVEQLLSGRRGHCIATGLNIIQEHRCTAYRFKLIRRIAADMVDWLSDISCVRAGNSTHLKAPPGSGQRQG